MSAEAERQQALLAAVAAGDAPVSVLRESGARLQRGLAAYRANADANADRALGTSFPTVRAMLGEEQFARLAAEFRRAQPPLRGDLGEWGDGLAAWIESHPGLTAWPWLADSARLDFAVHLNERAADAAPDLVSISLLRDHDPDRLQLCLVPGCAVLESAWPIGTILLAHRLEGAAAESAFATVRAALAERRREQVLVARQGWRGAVHPIDLATLGWLRALQAGCSLGKALERAGNAFDFTAWLALALRESWLERIVPIQGQVSAPGHT